MELEDRKHTLVTVVVPTFERPHLLRSAVASLVAQDHRDAFRYEVLVIDNASKGPETRQVVEEIVHTSPVPVRYVREERGGLSYARNRGIQEAAGEWIAFCDDDQIAEPDWLFELFSAARAHGAPCVGGSIRLMLPDQAPPLARFCRSLLGEYFFTGSPFVCTGRSIPSGGNLLMARRLFDELGTFDVGMITGCEDSELVLRIRDAGHPVLISPAAVIHHVIPPYRTESRYLLWAARRAGAGYAYTDLQKHGVTGVVARCLGRIAQAACITVPQLAIARLRNDTAGVQGCWARLSRMAGHAQQTLSLIQSRRTTETAFSRTMASRRERALFGSHAETGDARREVI
jgi:GT2 family glycosyltransferase